MPDQPASSPLTSSFALGIYAIVALAAGVGCGLLIRNSSAQDYADNQAAIQAMEAEEKAALQENRDRFAEMQDHEQQQLIDTYARIQAAEDRDALQATMASYYEWVKSLDYYDRNSLRGETMTVSQRIKRVNDVQLEQVSSLLLSRDDMAHLCNWLRKYVLVHVTEVPASEYEWSRNRTLALAFIKWINNDTPSEIPEPKTEMYSELAARLDIQQTAFESGTQSDASTESNRKEIVADWIFRNLFTVRSPGRGFSRGRPRVLNIDKDKLVEFLATDQLAPQIKKDLANLDVATQTRVLTHYYLKFKERPEWWQETDSGRSGRSGRRGSEGNRDGENRGGENRELRERGFFPPMIAPFAE